MKLELSEEKVHYTNGERRLFSILQRRKEWTVSKLACSFYGVDLPYHANGIVHHHLRQLAKKFKQTKEPFQICKSEFAGPHEITIWLEEK